MDLPPLPGNRSLPRFRDLIRRKVANRIVMFFLFGGGQRKFNIVPSTFLRYGVHLSMGGPTSTRGSAKCGFHRMLIVVYPFKSTSRESIKIQKHSIYAYSELIILTRSYLCSPLLKPDLSGANNFPIKKSGHRRSFCRSLTAFSAFPCRTF